MNGRWMTGCFVAVLCLGFLSADASAMYAPTVGRFLQRDPAGYVDSMSRYEYVTSAPMLFVDPQGEDADDVWNFHLKDHGGPHFQREVSGWSQRYDAGTLKPIRHGGRVPPELSRTERKALMKSRAYRKFTRQVLGLTVGAVAVLGSSLDAQAQILDILSESENYKILLGRWQACEFSDTEGYITALAADPVVGGGGEVFGKFQGAGTGADSASDSLVLQVRTLLREMQKYYMAECAKPGKERGSCSERWYYMAMLERTSRNPVTSRCMAAHHLRLAHCCLENGECDNSDSFRSCRDSSASLFEECMDANSKE